MSFHDDQPPIDEYDEYEDCVPVGLRWVMEKQDEILKLHSSEVQTNVFTQYVLCVLFPNPSSFHRLTASTVNVMLASSSSKAACSPRARRSKTMDQW